MSVTSTRRSTKKLTSESPTERRWLGKTVRTVPKTKDQCLEKMVNDGTINRQRRTSSSRGGNRRDTSRHRRGTTNARTIDATGAATNNATATTTTTTTTEAEGRLAHAPSYATTATGASHGGDHKRRHHHDRAIPATSHANTNMQAITTAEVGGEDEEEAVGREKEEEVEKDTAKEGMEEGTEGTSLSN